MITAVLFGKSMGVMANFAKFVALRAHGADALGFVARNGVELRD